MKICKHLKTSTINNKEKETYENMGFPYCDIPGSPFGRMEMINSCSAAPCWGDPTSNVCIYVLESSSYK